MSKSHKAGSALSASTPPRLQHEAWAARLDCCCRAGGLQTSKPLEAGHGKDMQQADGVTPPLQVLHLAQKEASAKASWLHVLN